MKTMIIPVEIPETVAKRIVFILFEDFMRIAEAAMNKGSKDMMMRKGIFTMTRLFPGSKILRAIIEMKISMVYIKSDVNNFSLRIICEKKTRAITPHPANAETI